MKRDMELIRKILLAIEASDSGWAPRPLQIEGYDDHAVGYHALLLVEAGLCEGDVTTSSGSKGPEGMITRLKWEGHDFLEAAKEPSRWEQAKKTIGEKLGTATFQVWTAVLTQVMLRTIGLS